MKRDKYITIQEPIFIQGDTGGTRESFVQYWSGWASVTEKNYNTITEEAQFVGQKSITINLWKNGKTDKVNSTMRVDYRSNIYLINSIIELDRFTLQLTATIKERNGGNSSPATVPNNSLDASLDFAL